MELTAERKAELAKAGAWVRKTSTEPVDTLLGILDERKKAILSEMEGLTPEQGRFSPGPGKWSIEEVALHLAHAHRGCANLVESLADGVTPGFKVEMGLLDPNPNDYAKALKSFSDSFENLSAAGERLRNPCHLDKTVTHPYFGEFNCREWFTFCALHIMPHIAQIRRIKAAPGYPA